jgi:hypothetical protein
MADEGNQEKTLFDQHYGVLFRRWFGWPQGSPETITMVKKLCRTVSSR